jgi:asparagine synthase (glutamine-hydrolysing)
MGGIYGVVHNGNIQAREPWFQGNRPPAGEAWKIEPSAAFSARSRSTLALSERSWVMVAGHFDRSPATGLSAAESLLVAWEKEGIDALNRLDGAWVAAILDRHSNRLHLLRDPFGIRRVFFSYRNGQIAFSTRMRELLELQWVSRDLAREHLAEYLSFRYVHAPRTLLRDVYALPAGHQLEFDGRQLDIRPWFRLRYCPPFTRAPDDKNTLEELDRRLNRAVSARASGRERIGVFLSGGLDSSIITAVATRLGEVHTYTVGVEDAEDDEVPYASRVANLLRTRHCVVRVSPEIFQNAFMPIVEGSDLPVTDPAAIPQLLLAQTASKDIDVILSGDGGDEIFGGRMVGTVAAQLRLSTWLARLPGPIRRTLGGFLKDRPELMDPTAPVGLARRIGGLQIFDRTDRTQLMRDPGWVRPGVRRTCLEPFYREVVSDPINEILHAWLKGRMVEDGLTRAGIAASLSGVGLREPLLDRELVSFCAGIPGPWKVRSHAGGATTKWPLRELLKPVLGRAMVNRPKRVLPGPWQRWFEGPLRKFMQERADLLREDAFRLFLPGAIDSLTSRMSQPGVDTKVWTLIFLDAWARSVKAT